MTEWEQQGKVGPYYRAGTGGERRSRRRRRPGRWLGERTPWLGWVGLGFGCGGRDDAGSGMASPLLMNDAMVQLLGWGGVRCAEVVRRASKPWALCTEWPRAVGSDKRSSLYRRMEEAHPSHGGAGWKNTGSDPLRANLKYRKIYNERPLDLVLSSDVWHGHPI
jgi:hypothetical protein